MEKKIKCVIWDLDNTIWEGTILENKSIQPFEHVIKCIKKLDERGIIHSIASRNNYDDAMFYLKRFGLADYFIYPQICWGSKSSSVEIIIKNLNISADSVAFVDDQYFELDEVKKVHPEVLCVHSKDISKMLTDDRFIPTHITEDSKMRRTMYKADISRNNDAKQFLGTHEEFLRTLNMEITVSYAKDDDLDRLVELTERTSQLNTTGYIYTYEELSALSNSSEYRLLVVELKDRYGASGKIGLALIKIGIEDWLIKQLIMSCRVLSRGIGSLLIDFILDKAQQKNCAVYAQFRKTSRNKMMYMTYIMAGFVPLNWKKEIIILKHPMKNIHALPPYIKINDNTKSLL